MVLHRALADGRCLVDERFVVAGLRAVQGRFEGLKGLTYASAKRGNGVRSRWHSRQPAKPEGALAAVTETGNDENCTVSSLP
jgi:hypothetical protein